MVDMAEWTLIQKRRLVLIATCIATFVSPAMGTMVNLALTAIGAEFNVSTHDLGWIASCFFIASVIFLPPMARLSDIYGKKKIFYVGLLILLIGSILSSLSTDMVMLCASRVIVGAGSSAISCCTISMIAELYPPETRGAAIGINTAAVYLGLSLGPVIGGFLTEMLGWRSVFYIIIPISLITWMVMFLSKQEFSGDPSRTFDAKGSVFYGLMITVLMAGVVNLPDTWAVIAIAAGLVMLVLFLRSQTKIDEPIFNVNLFRSSRFTRAIFATFLNYASVYCVSFFLALYLQTIGELSASTAGLVLLSQPMIQVIFTPVMGRLSDRMDKRYLPTIGMAITTVGLVMLLFVGLKVDIPLIVVAEVIIGFGYATFSAPNTAAIMSYVPKEEYNNASATIAVLRQTGTMASMGMAMCVIALVMGSAESLLPDNFSAFVSTMHVSWIICIIMCMTGSLISWFRGAASSNGEHDG
ncbi:MAG: MFS transporter [Candidatus Methanomethylophilaceae archaeon]